MANTYKDIIISPNKGSNTNDPKIEFRAANTSTNTDILLYVSPDNAGTLTFQSIADSLVSISANTDKILTLGNTTTNVVINAVSVQFSNSTANLTIKIPSTAVSGATNYFLHANGSWIQVNQSANIAVSSSAPASPSEGTLWWDTDVSRLFIYYNSAWTEAEAPSGSNTEIQFNDSGAFGADSGLLYNKLTDTLSVTNTSANVQINPSSLKIANSISNTVLTIPTTTAWSATNYFLHANGSWVEVSATGNQTYGTRVYQRFTATASQNTFAITGGYANNFIDVFYNGAHLGTDEYAQNSTHIQLSIDALENSIVEVVGFKDINLAAVSVDQNAQYTWTNTQTFTNTISFTQTINATSNNTLYVGSVAAANVVSNSQLSANLAYYVNTSANYTVAGNLNLTGTNNYFSSAVYLGANVSLTTSSGFIGNSTANNIYNQTTISLANSTGNTQVSPFAYNLANSTVTSNLQIGQLNVGANSSVSTTTHFIGNSTANALLNQTTLAISNSTGNTQVSSFAYNLANSTVTSNLQIGQLNIGANVNLSTTTGFFGNSTANNVLNQTSISVANSTGNTQVTPFAYNLANSTVTSNLQIGQLNIGANAYVNTTAYYVGNSTVNTVITQTTASFFTNSTATALSVASTGNVAIPKAVLTTIYANSAIGSNGLILASNSTGGAFWSKYLPRANNQTSITSPLAWNSDNFDSYTANAQSTAFTISADAGTPTDGQKAIFRILDNGTSRTITFTGGASKAFKPVGVTLTTSGSDFTYATTISKVVYFGCIYNANSDRWEIVALSQE